MTDEKHPIEAKLELLAKITQMTLGSVIKILHDRQGGPLSAEQQAKLELVRADIERSVEAVKGWQQERPSGDLDLSGLQGRLESILKELAEDESPPVPPASPPDAAEPS